MASPEAGGETEQKIREILDNEIRPAVAQDGGDITLDRYEAGIVYLQMKGSCSGCPSSTATLKMGIENRLRELVPEVAEVYYYVRHPDPEVTRQVYERLLKCARAGALATDTRLEVIYLGGTLQLVPNEVLEKAALANLKRLNDLKYDEEEMKFALRLQETLANRVALDTVSQVFVSTGEINKGSTDVSDVSWIVPTGGHLGGGEPKIDRLGEGRVPGERDVVPTLEGRGEHARRGEAVENDGDGGRHVGENRERVLLGRPRMDHQRLRDLRRKLDVLPEEAHLLVPRSVSAVVVEPGLADGTHAVACQQSGDLVEGGLEVRVGQPRSLVGVQGDGGNHCWVTLGELRPPPRAVDVVADLHHLRHPHRLGQAQRVVDGQT